MTKLNTEKKFVLLPSEPLTEAGPTSRFMVLVPDIETDLTPVARRVWQLASPTGAKVKLLGIFDDASREPALRRRLATLSAIVSSGDVPSEAEVIYGRDWVMAIRSRWQPGDVVVCWNGAHGDSLHKPLSQILRSNLDVPLYVLSGQDPQADPEMHRRSSWLTQAAAWAGCIAILLGFFALQVKISDFAGDGINVLLLLSIPVEIWLLWAWNNLIR